MITCYLQGGLGNQLFQVASTLSFAWENNIESIFNLNIHNLPLQGNKAITYKDIFYRHLKLTDENLLNKCKIYGEPNFHYDKIPDYVSKEDYMLHGYFQTEKYFDKYRDRIIEYFKPNVSTIEYLKKYDDVLKGNTCSVHVRRGDYLSLPNDHPVLKSDYYEKSFNKMKKGAKFIVFSDDINWCKENLKGDNMTYIDEKDDYVNLLLMSLCKHNIIANSSFSWWGAWLNNNKNKIVIAPKGWFGVNKNLNTKDLIPSKWITI